MEPNLQNDPHAAQQEHPNRQFDQEASSGRRINLLTGMLLGAVVGGLLTMLSSTNRQNTKQGLSGAKDSVSSLASTIKEDPSGKASQVIEQVKSASGIIQEVAGDVQNVYDKVNNELDTVKSDASSVKDTATEAKGDLSSISEKVVEAKDVALGKEEAPQNNQSDNSQQNK
ncbi:MULTISPECIES: YtxH domain-containing protein [Exiguobacterium]|uniref:YtxH domain-containing protein n=1 Tax=Exiguobacterium TaxID=33986 RepID=UPI000493E828|nr:MULTISPECIES: YtxH domain-containing protein [Exiguobacterium]